MLIEYKRTVTALSCSDKDTLKLSQQTQLKQDTSVGMRQDNDKYFAKKGAKLK